MKSLLRLVICCLVAGLAVAHTATLAPSTNTLASEGGTLTLTAVATYEGEPGALDWSIELPSDWTLLSLTGPDAPAVSPAGRTTGTLEFAYLATPSGRAEFSVQESYPAKSAPATVMSTVLLRVGGKLATLRAPAIQFVSGAPAGTTCTRN